MKNDQKMFVVVLSMLVLLFIFSILIYNIKKPYSTEDLNGVWTGESISIENDNVYSRDVTIRYDSSSDNLAILYKDIENDLNRKMYLTVNGNGDIYGVQKPSTIYGKFIDKNNIKLYYSEQETPNDIKNGGRIGNTMALAVQHLTKN